MPFSKIITNPPYDKNLHLKILREAMKHIEKEGGEIVNLSPIKWHNPRALIDDNNNSAHKIVSDFSDIFSHLKDLQVIDSEKVKAMFDTCDSNDLGIYYITNEGGHSAEEYIYEPLAIKLLKMEGTKWLSEMTTVLPQSDEFIRMPTIYGNENKEWLKKVCSPDFNRYYKLNKGQKHCRPYVNFSTKEECINFHKSLSLKLIRWLNFKCRFGANICQEAIPFLPTYKKQWTDADLYEYFKLNTDEIKIIEEEMK